MAFQAPSWLQQKGVVVWLLGLTVLYQLARHVFLRSSVKEADSAEDGCSANLASSPRCLELEMFRTWHRAVPVFQGMELDGMVSIEDMTTWAPSALNASTPSLPSGLNATVVVGKRMPAVVSSEGLADGDASVLEPEAWQSIVDGQRDEHGEEGMLERAPHSVADAPLGERGDEDGVVRRQRERAEMHEQFEQHAERITKSLSERGSLTRWGQDLQQLQGNMEAKMAALPSQRGKQASSARPALASGSSEEQRPTVENSVLHEINALLRVMCDDPRHHDHKVCAPLLAKLADAHADVSLSTPEERHARLEADMARMKSEHAAWQHNFDDKVTATHKELCEDPARRDRPDCIKFLASLAQTEQGKHRELQEAHQASREVLRSSVGQEARARAQVLEKQLSEIVSERQAWEAELLKQYGIGEHVRHGHHHHTTPAKASEQSAAPQDADQLHWSSVESWPMNRRLRGSFQKASGHGGHAVLHREELRAARWAGRIPKVACVSAFKSSTAAKIQMKYFVENFRKQTYEGSMQLVLVYNHNDLEAAKLVQMYADGSYIKAVAAQSEEAEFPATTDLRYGAWAADGADVVASWAFDEWHHPERLSMQVRALAFSSRPACMLRLQAAAGEASEEEGSTGPSEETLLGEKEWMREHWHPWLQEQNAVLKSAQAFQVVELDMLAAGRGEDSSRDSAENAGSSGTPTKVDEVTFCRARREGPGVRSSPSSAPHKLLWTWDPGIRASRARISIRQMNRLRAARPSRAGY
eukprot:CAMPEP_0203873664 /NCGR_PEP_ID=MMETSP0359-20131031/19863_1 /ASSEMBLY_ACC=CAM_ASM_000338 /TAXON_ID=268821 /ORGANISM="Scrippsiella Hangoei, Strain SHTV-5" /LENGTH=757 /DNA_ID=CAMNT_0050792365 /DNA_START=123 /DNA_END=2397 /DNA_ORIENTATION=-